MTQIGWKPLLVIYLVGGGLSMIALRWLQLRGTDPFPAPASVIAVLMLIAVTVLLLGLRVRRWVQRGQHFDAIGATRTLALAQAAALVGALQGGYFTAQIVTVYDSLPAPDAQEVTYSAIGAMIAAGALLAAGLIAQWACRVPPEESDPHNPATSG